MRVSSIMLIVGIAALVLMIGWAVIDANYQKNELDDRWK